MVTGEQEMLSAETSDVGVTGLGLGSLKLVKIACGESEPEPLACRVKTFTQLKHILSMIYKS